MTIIIINYDLPSYVRTLYNRSMLQLCLLLCMSAGTLFFIFLLLAS